MIALSELNWIYGIFIIVVFILILYSIKKTNNISFKQAYLFLEKTRKEKLDLNTKYKNYFSKFIFRIAFILCLIYFVSILSINGFPSEYVYINCPANSMQGFCYNPFYVCTNATSIEQPCLHNPDRPQMQRICAKGLCNNATIPAGSYMGEKEPYVFQIQYTVYISIFILAFLLNHFLYIYRYQKKIIKRLNK